MAGPHKEKNEFLTTELMKYKAFKDENDELKIQFEEKKTELVDKLQQSENEKAIAMKQHEDLIQTIELKQKQYELSQKEAVLNAKEEHQLEIQALLAKHQVTIEEYQITLNTIREEKEVALAKQKETFDEVIAVKEAELAQKHEEFEKNITMLEKQVEGLQKELATYRNKPK